MLKPSPQAFRFRRLEDAFFFFQAEDGIRDKLVTGVQTCALPISELRVAADLDAERHAARVLGEPERAPELSREERSEERRVGKSVDLGGRRIIKKKRR